MKRILILVLLFVFPVPVSAQSVKWSTARSVRKELKRQAKKGKTFYSQFDWYAPRKSGDLQSRYSDDIGKDLLIYGVDFYYASGTWFSESYQKTCRENLVGVVKEAWRKNRAIPSFSWHLENPYANSECNEEYMGCRYRYAPNVWPNYPEEHRYVIREILNNTGGGCGSGRYRQANEPLHYSNPREWFEDRCKEVAGIINELTTEKGKPIPIIFRLWHECEDSWHWWGKTSCTDEEYKEFYVLTERLIKKYAPKSRILWGFCTDYYWANEDDYLRRYPGDNYVDIMGYDDYSIRENNKDNPSLVRAQAITRLSKEHKKLAAIFETNNKDAKTSDRFFREKVSTILEDQQTEIVLFQMWSSGVYSSEAEKQDRAWMLNRPYIITTQQ